MKELKTICADIYALRDQLEFRQKEDEGGLKDILSETSRNVHPDPEVIAFAERWINEVVNKRRQKGAA